MRYFSFEEHQSRKRVYTIFLCLFQVADFHESYIMLVAIIVDILKFA